jgi:hypothetical protein
VPPDGVPVINPRAELDIDYLAVKSLVFDSRSACFCHVRVEF